MRRISQAKRAMFRGDDQEFHKRDGWTLLELLVVVALLGMLMAGGHLVLKNVLSVNRHRADRDAVLLWDKTTRSASRRFTRLSELGIDWRPEARLQRRIKGRDSQWDRASFFVPTLIDLRILETKSAVREQSIPFDHRGRSPTYALKFQEPGGAASWIVVVGETGQILSGMSERDIHELATVLQ